MQTKKHMDENNGSGFAVGGMDDPAVTAAIVFINELLGGNCGGHDAAHSMRVYRNAMMIARDEPGCDLRIAALAALLHDADDHKLFATVDCANARSFLSGVDMIAKREREYEGKMAAIPVGAGLRVGAAVRGPGAGGRG